MGSTARDRGTLPFGSTAAIWVGNRLRTVDRISQRSSRPLATEWARVGSSLNIVPFFPSTRMDVACDFLSPLGFVALRLSRVLAWNFLVGGDALSVYQ